MEQQTKKPKRMLLYSILAITIGIATILPLTYLTLTGNATNRSFYASGQPEPPFFTPYIAGVMVIPDVTTILSNSGLNEAGIDVQVCYHITSSGADFKDIDAKIEVYNIHFYSDKGSILNMKQLVAVTGNVPDPNSPNDVISAITATGGYAHYDTPEGWANHKDTITFADGTVYDVTNLLGYTESRWLREGDVEYYTTNGHLCTNVGAVLSLSKGEKSAQSLTDLRNAGTIYMDITRVMQITYKHPSSTNPSSVITATPITSNEVLGHIQLPKLDDLGRMWYNAGLIEHEWVTSLD
jgi:hypothetical protein